MSDFRERFEIELLNSQLKDQQEQSKAKESRLLSTQERQRKRIIELETKNKELMGEISILERDRAAMIQVSIKSNVGQSAKSKPTSASFPKPLKGLKDLEIKSNIPTKSVLTKTKSNTRMATAQSMPNLDKHNTESRQSSAECLVKSNIAVEEIPISSIDILDLDKLQAQLGLPVYISQEIFPDKSTQRTYQDSTILIRLPDGTMKLQREDVNVIYYTNGDSKTELQDNTVIFWYNNAKTRHTTLPDGTEICEFEDGQVERKYPDGTLTVQFPDDTIKLIEADGTVFLVFANIRKR
jgi:T-complex protein 10 C-terminus